MKTDPPTSPAAPQPPRPRGRVFDVMAPGKAPASPTSRPVVIGHQPEAQSTQIAVSGIGAPEPRELLNSRQKIEITPTHIIDPAESTPKTSVRDKQANEASFATAIAPSPIPAASSSPAPGMPAPPEREAGDHNANAALAAVAMEPEAPEPEALATEQPAPPAPEPAHDDPLHDIASPSLDHQVVVSHHTTMPGGTGKLLLLITLAVVFALLVLDILMDAGVIGGFGLPHTNFF